MHATILYTSNDDDNSRRNFTYISLIDDIIASLFSSLCSIPPSLVCRPESAVHDLGQPSNLSFPASSATVVSEITEVGPGVFCATLHSGLCVRNALDIALETKLQTCSPTDGGSHCSLGVLSPRQCSWLPVLRPQAAALHARPCPSYRPSPFSLRTTTTPLPKQGTGSTSYHASLPTTTLAPGGMFYRNTGAQNSLFQRKNSNDAESTILGSLLSHCFEWSEGIAIEDSLVQVQQAQAPPLIKQTFPLHVSCAPTSLGSSMSPLILSVGSHPIGRGARESLLRVTIILVSGNRIPFHKKNPSFLFLFWRGH